MTSNQLIEAVVAAVSRGYQPIPIRASTKKPHVPGWTHLTWTDDDDGHGLAREQFTAWAAEGATNLGLALGEPSGGLVDVDFDHPRTSRLKDHFLPRTAMRSGREHRPGSHYWYRVKPGTLPGTRRYKMGDGKTVSVELRSDKAQTLIPPSLHPSGDHYVWEGEPWGGDAGPLEVDGRVLAVQVALLGLGTILVDAWPSQGSRHDAYLALAGGLLRFGEGEVHPYWERNAAVLIRALATGTHDEDGPDAREHETLGTTLTKIREGRPAVGFPRLAELIGDEPVNQVRRMVAEVESLAGFRSRNAPKPDAPDGPITYRAGDASPGPTGGDLPDDRPLPAADAREEDSEPAGGARDPLSERAGSWAPVDLEPYLLGQIQPVSPTVLTRDDGAALLYPGRINMLYGSSESAKSWLALYACMQEISKGERVVYLDMEDEPSSTVERLRLMGSGNDDIRLGFTYIRPEDPIAPMQRNRWGSHAPSSSGELNFDLFELELAVVDPSVIVVDGMTVLYGLHGLDSNDAGSTDVITSWLKKLTRNGRTTVIVIDHTTKNAERGSLPIGSQHKVAMIQGAMLQVWPVKQPMPGAFGEVELIVLKDRPGQVRAVSANGSGKAQSAAKVTIDSTVPGRTVITVSAPPGVAQAANGGGDGQTPGPGITVDLSGSKAAAKAQALRALDDAVLDAFGGELGRALTVRDVADATSLSDAKVRAHLARLTVQGWLAEDLAPSKGRGQPAKLWVLQLGSDDEDDDSA